MLKFQQFWVIYSFHPMHTRKSFVVLNIFHFYRSLINRHYGRSICLGQNRIVGRPRGWWTNKLQWIKSIFFIASSVSAKDLELKLNLIDNNNWSQHFLIHCDIFMPLAFNAPIRYMHAIFFDKYSLHFFCRHSVLFYYPNHRDTQSISRDIFLFN